jgi:cation diffusion facilitator CzcD-associated flavoprotein CzcO
MKQIPAEAEAVVIGSGISGLAAAGDKQAKSVIR